MNQGDASAPATTLTLLGTIVALLGILATEDLTQVALGLAAVTVGAAIDRLERRSARRRTSSIAAPAMSQVTSKTRAEDGDDRTPIDRTPIPEEST